MSLNFLCSHGKKNCHALIDAANRRFDSGGIVPTRAGLDRQSNGRSLEPPVRVDVNYFVVLNEFKTKQNH